jgi:mannose-6-phosphate isomerase
MSDPFQPAVLTFTPVYKPYLWGGTRLPKLFGRVAPKLDRYAESWEISDLAEGMSVAEAGAYAGRSLRDLLRDYGKSVTGRDTSAFPLLIKILDAADRLSVQVHPDEVSAKEHGGHPKTECWFVLDAKPGAVVWAGLKPGVTPESFRHALESHGVPDLLQCLPVSTGDLLYIPGGRVHAIGAGCLILEVQQSSNTTYRVFDWNRKDADGKTRERHVEQAMRTIRWDDTSSARIAPGPILEQGANTIRDRIACPCFRVEELNLLEPLAVNHSGNSFHILFVVSGGVRVRGSGPETDLPAGSTALIPAAVRDYLLEPLQENAAVIRISGPAHMG